MNQEARTPVFDNNKYGPLDNNSRSARASVFDNNK